MPWNCRLWPGARTLTGRWGHAAVHGRLATGDLDSILAAKGHDATRRGASADTSLAQGTQGWNLFGRSIVDTPEAGIP